MMSTDTTTQAPDPEQVTPRKVIRRPNSARKNQFSALARAKAAEREALAQEWEATSIAHLMRFSHLFATMGFPSQVRELSALAKAFQAHVETGRKLFGLDSNHYHPATKIAIQLNDLGSRSVSIGAC